jgi:hypothetical protein
MPSLIGTPVAANYAKAQPSTTFGTRELLFLQVDMNTDVQTGYTDSDSLYAKAIRGLQTQVELYGVGTPQGNWFVAIASSNTAPLNDGQGIADGNRVGRLEDAIDDTAGVSCNVWNSRLRGDNLENNC